MQVREVSRSLHHRWPAPCRRRQRPAVHCFTRDHITDAAERPTRARSPV